MCRSRSGWRRRSRTICCPREAPQVEGYLLAGRNIPAQRVGGDYFDFLDVSGGSLGGVRRGCFRQGTPCVAADVEPAGNVARSDAGLGRSGRMSGTREHAAVPEHESGEVRDTVARVFWIRSGTRFVYANAGHEHPAVLKAVGSGASLGRTPLAMLESFPTNRVSAWIRGYHCHLSDGVPEAMDPEGACTGTRIPTF